MIVGFALLLCGENSKSALKKTMFHHNYHSVEFLVSIIIPFRIPQPCTQWKNSWSSKDIWNVLLNKKSDVHNWKKKRWGFICSGKHIFFFLKIGVIFTLKKKPALFVSVRDKNDLKGTYWCSILAQCLCNHIWKNIQKLQP